MAIPPNVKDEGLEVVARSSASATDEDAHHLTVRSDTANEVDEAQNSVVRQEFDFPGNLASLDESRERIMQFVTQHCPDEGDQIDILVALQEALANAALHGCGDDPAKRIQCWVAVDASDIAIIVRDPGHGFDLALADPDNYFVSTSPHGRGICLIRSLMTQVVYAGGGSELQMRKRIQRASL